MKSGKNGIKRADNGFQFYWSTNKGGEVWGFLEDASGMAIIESYMQYATTDPEEAFRHAMNTYGAQEKACCP